jgi:2-octaprenyl-6-methoxyphenol hydroxylase
MTEKRDIVIAGGGMVGISLALQLAATLPEDVGITLVEGFALPPPAADGRPDYHPSFDARSTALSYSTRLVYESIGVWQELSHRLCPIDTIHVSNRGRFGSAVLQADDYDWPALGYVVENAWLGNSLIQQLHRQSRVELLCPARVVAAKPHVSGLDITVEAGETQQIHAQLLVVADGAGSGLRDALGVSVAEKPYRQQALIANVAFAQPHEGCAFERFTDEGPLALLPLPGVTGAAHRSALVWTLPPEQAEHLRDCEDEEFLAALQDRFGYRLGRLRQVGERHTYPLALMESDEQVRHGVVVMGNAAHALHPVAGQGYNLAMRDVAELTSVLDDAIRAGESPGALSVLQRYRRRQQKDQARTIAMSDLLPGLFMKSDPVLGLARDMALAGLDVMAPLKREFVRYAAGVAALGEAHG